MAAGGIGQGVNPLAGIDEDRVTAMIFPGQGFTGGMPLIVFALGLLVSGMGAFVGLIVWVGKRELNRVDDHEKRLDEAEKAQIKLAHAMESLISACATYRSGFDQQFVDGKKTFDEVKKDIAHIRESQHSTQIAIAQICQKIDDLLRRFERHEDRIDAVQEP